MAIPGFVALITGASEGLGRAVAQRFCRQGARLILIDKELTQLPDDLKSYKDTLSLKVDITSDMEISSVFDKTQEKFGRLDVVVNCMESSQSHVVYNLKRGSNTWKNQVQKLDNMYTFNTISTFNICRHAAQLMVKNEADRHGQRGCIINMSQLAADEGEIGQYQYSATKAAINAMTLPLARDLASDGIRVNTIQIGTMEIPLHTQVGQLGRIILSGCMLTRNGKFGDPCEYAHLCDTILNNPLINGEILRLDAGQRSHGYIEKRLYSEKS